MTYTYLLKSIVNNDIYVGYSSDLKKRFKEHNDGKVKSTKSYRPWILVYYEAYRSKDDASKREKQLKMHKAKSDLLEQIKNSLA